MIASRDLASAAGNIGFHCNPLAGLKVVPLGGFASHLNNLACYLVPHDQRNLALLVDRISAARVPIPTRMVAEVLEGFGRGGRAGLGPDALPIPLPDGVRSVHVQRDSMVFIAEREN